MCDHTAATATRHWSAASARKIRSVERETRWRWRLKVLWTAASMLRKRWAERADLNAAVSAIVVAPADVSFRHDYFCAGPAHAGSSVAASGMQRRKSAACR